MEKSRTLATNFKSMNPNPNSSYMRTDPAKTLMIRYLIPMMTSECFLQMVSGSSWNGCFRELKSGRCCWREGKKEEMAMDSLY